MDRYNIAIGSDLIDLLRRLDNSRCPKCGDEVFIVKKGFQEEYGGTREDPIVFCRDMGHWVGRLSDCKRV